MRNGIGSKGISLVEVTIASAIAIAVGLGVAKMSVNTNQSIKLSERNQEIIAILGEIRGILSIPASCKSTFGGMDATSTPALTQILNTSGDVAFEVGKQYGSSGLKIDAMRIDSASSEVTVVPDGVGTTDFIITFDRRKKVPGTKLIDKKIRLSVNTINTNEIDTCNSFSSGVSSIWKRNSVSTSNIFYNDGNVGIGSDTPTRNLHILENKNGAVGIDIENRNSDPKAATKIRFLGPGTAGAMIGVMGPNHIQPEVRDKLFINVGTNGKGIVLGTQNGIDFTNGSSAVTHFDLTAGSNPKIGIGTRTPTRNLHILENKNGAVGIDIENRNNGPKAATKIRFRGPGTAGAMIGVMAPNHVTPLLRDKLVIRSGANAKGTMIFSEYSFDVSNGSENSAAFFDLTTGNTKVGIGTRTPSYKLHVMGQVAGSSAFVNTSDERYKKNIESIPSALSKIMGLNGVYFDWRHDEYPKMNFVEKRDLGVIAQNVERFFPEAVVEDKDGFKSVAYSKLVAPLIEAVKEQQSSIKALNLKFSALEVENKVLKSYLCHKDPKAPFCN